MSTGSPFRLLMGPGDSIRYGNKKMTKNVSTQTENVHIQTTTEMEQYNSNRALLDKLLANVEHDVTLRCHGDIDVTASSVVLSAKSDVFHAMFNGNFLEAKNKTIGFSDWYASVVRKFVECTHSATHINLENCSNACLLSLVCLFDKYMMHSLKIHAVEYIRLRCHLWENVLEFLPNYCIAPIELRNVLCNAILAIIKSPQYSSITLRDLDDVIRGDVQTLILSL